MRDEALDADGAGLGRGGRGAVRFRPRNSGIADAGQVMAGARAHNRWLAELCSESPDRRIGLALIPLLHDQATTYDVHEAPIPANPDGEHTAESVADAVPV